MDGWMRGREMGRNQLGAQKDEICPRCEEPIPGGDQMKHRKQNQASWRGPGEGHFVLWGEDRGVGGPPKRGISDLGHKGTGNHRSGGEGSGLWVERPRGCQPGWSKGPRAECWGKKPRHAVESLSCLPQAPPALRTCFCPLAAEASASSFCTQPRPWLVAPPQCWGWTWLPQPCCPAMTQTLAWCCSPARWAGAHRWGLWAGMAGKAPEASRFTAAIPHTPYP